MPETTRNGPIRNCPICGRGKLRERWISEVFEYGADGDAVTVKTQNVPIEDCDVCGESFSGPEAARIRHEAIAVALGLLPSQEIRVIRERLGQSIDQFAKLIGVKTDRLAQWESGTNWQDRTADRLLRLLAARSENVQYLESLAMDSPGAAKEPDPEVQTAAPKKPRRRIVLPHERERYGL
jgi:putative zinc finger/helix-turn-helix YgiT family protein